MDKLPCDIINNILIIKYEEEIKQLNREIKKQKLRAEFINHTFKNMEYYIESHNIKCCDECCIYGDDDQIIFYENYEKDLCEECEQYEEENSL
tara:strand:- start:749 stop:1027 length:279 start_codon:yes stop_codon:yes gene_type:complete